MKWFFVGIYSGGVDKKHIPDQADRVLIPDESIVPLFLTIPAGNLILSINHQ